MIKTLSPKTVFSIAVVIILFAWLAKRQAGQAVQAVNPLNNDNVFAQAANGVVEAVSSGESKTTGSAWYKHCRDKNFAPWYCPNV